MIHWWQDSAGMIKASTKNSVHHVTLSAEDDKTDVLTANTCFPLPTVGCAWE